MRSPFEPSWPKQEPSVETLREFLNVGSSNDFVLVVAWALAVLRDKGPYAACWVASIARSVRAWMGGAASSVRNARPRDSIISMRRH